MGLPSERLTLAMINSCPICDKPFDSSSPDGLAWGSGSKEDEAYVKCKICGTYRIMERAVGQAQESGLKLDPARASLLSGAIREQYEEGIEPVVRDLDQLEAQVSVKDDPLKSIDKIVWYVYNKAGSAADFVRLDKEVDFPIGYARGPEEFGFFLDKAVELGFLERKTQVQETARFKNPSYRLTVREGWKRVNELRTTQRAYWQAFVAMWFAEEMNEAFSEGFYKALQDAGYDALRIDMREHNEKIDDRIIAEIRRSSLLVADFTDHRGGVYFEAGFAMGLGIPVIWTCREDHIGELHFDTRQYNHIVWKTPEDLREKLRLRIEATLPVRAGHRLGAKRDGP